MMYVVLAFVIGYLAIVFEHPLKIDKTIPALLAGVVCWSLISILHLPVLDSNFEVPHGDYIEGLEEVLLHHIGKIAEILFFLIGAMTIVELVDLHNGFSAITNRIKTTKKTTLLFIITPLAFFLSAVLDNLTCTIVIISLLRKLVPDPTERMWYASLTVIAANAGGAWSPIGDVTTTMLWINDKITSGTVIAKIFIPSVICAVVPMLILSRLKVFRGNVTPAQGAVVDAADPHHSKDSHEVVGSQQMLIAGVGALIFVPIFKVVTHLPPYVGMMLGLGVVWLLSEILHRDEDFERKHKYTAHYALSRIEMSSILFFLGILVAVAALESLGALLQMAQGLDGLFPDKNVVALLLGFLSAVIDNVPLVAASMGMYTDAIDSPFWLFIAYTAGTGGSMLIIGSAAGVAAMGMERIDFIWYLKKIAWIAALGYLAGAAFFMLLG